MGDADLATDFEVGPVANDDRAILAGWPLLLRLIRATSLTSDGF